MKAPQHSYQRDAHPETGGGYFELLGAPAGWPRRRLRGVRRTAAWWQNDSNNKRQRALYWNNWLAVTNVWPEVSDWKRAGAFELANDCRTYRAVLVGIGADVEMRRRQRDQRSEGKRDQRTTDAAPNAVVAATKNHYADFATDRSSWEFRATGGQVKLASLAELGRDGRIMSAIPRPSQERTREISRELRISVVVN